MKYTLKDIDYLINRANEKLAEREEGYKLVTYYCYGAYGIDKQRNGSTGTSTLFNLTTKNNLALQLKAFINGLDGKY